MNDSKNKVSQAMDARTNPLHGSNGGEMLAPAIRQIPLENIRPDPDQPRRRVATDGPEWEGLLASVREHGVLQPILVQPVPDQRGQYMIVSGERRWQAAKVAQHSHITARIIKSDAMLARKAEIQLIENALRQGLSPLDEMEACVRLVQEEGWSKTQLAGKLGVTKSVVSDIFKLDQLHPEVRAGIRVHGLKLSRRQLLAVAQGHGLEEQVRVLGRITDNGKRKSTDKINNDDATAAAQQPAAGPRWGSGGHEPHFLEFSGPHYDFNMTLADDEPDENAEVEVETTVYGHMAEKKLADIFRRIADRLEFGSHVESMLLPYRRRLPERDARDQDIAD